MIASASGHIDIVKALLTVPGIDASMRDKVRNHDDIITYNCLLY